MIRLVSVIILLVIISACTPSQQVINSWKNPDVKEVSVDEYISESARAAKSGLYQ